MLLHVTRLGGYFWWAYSWLEMRVHPAKTPLLITPTLGRNPTPSTPTTAHCPEKNMGTKRREMVDVLFTLQDMSSLLIVACRLAQQIEMGIRQTGSTTANFFCNLPLPNEQSRLPHHSVQRTVVVVSLFRRLPLSTPNRCMSRLHPHIVSFYVRKSPPVIGPGVEHQP